MEQEEGPICQYRGLLGVGWSGCGGGGSGELPSGMLARELGTYLETGFVCTSVVVML